MQPRTCMAALLVVVAGCGTSRVVADPAPTSPTTRPPPSSSVPRHKPPPHKRRVVVPLSTTTTTRPHVTQTLPPTTTTTAAVVIMPQTNTTLDCIKAHESGDYTESSHPWDGSGAYQWIPSSWQEWSARAGLGGYEYAYEAPPGVQDAVTEYALTHGGAGNWSTRYGNDPCTE